MMAENKLDQASFPGTWICNSNGAQPCSRTLSILNLSSETWQTPPSQQCRNPWIVQTVTQWIVWCRHSSMLLESKWQKFSWRWRVPVRMRRQLRFWEDSGMGRVFWRREEWMRWWGGWLMGCWSSTVKGSSRSMMLRSQRWFKHPLAETSLPDKSL